MRNCFGMNEMAVATSGRVHVDYDRDLDLLFAWIGDPQPAVNVEIRPGFAVRVANGRAIGLEAVDCAAQFNRQPTQINRAFVQSLLAEYGPQAVATVNR